MIFGIGTDVVQLARVEEVYARHGEHFVRRLLMPEEEAGFRTLQAAGALPRDALRGQGSDRQGARHRLRARHLDPRRRHRAERLGPAGGDLVGARPRACATSSAPAKATSP